VLVGAPKPDTAALLAQQEPGQPAPAPTQEAVLAGVVAGERWAHAALYDALSPVVARTLQKILRGTSGDYEDLVQTSFERIVRTLSSERASPIANLPAWAGAIAAHVALDALRGRSRDRRRFELERAQTPRIEGLPAPSLERQLEARQKLEWLQETLSRMNPDQAQTILLHDVLGHGLADIAALTGVTIAAAQRRLSRGHQELLRRAKARGIGARS
jgi:RNA polymerase sigma-70 factor, ECF subfamily